MNIQKVKALADAQGIKYGKVCEAVGKKHTYLNDISKGIIKNVPEENVLTIARFLGTSFEYLMDITDDPEPDFLMRSAESLDNQIVNEMIRRLTAMPTEQQETVSRLLKLPDNEFQRALNMLNLMWGE
jgi:transcriptional regulator with XRE-family HTH domain